MDSGMFQSSGQEQGGAKKDKPFVSNRGVNQRLTELVNRVDIQTKKIEKHENLLLVGFFVVVLMTGAMVITVVLFNIQMEATLNQGAQPQVIIIKNEP